MAGIRDLEDVVPRLKEVRDSLEDMEEVLDTAYRTMRSVTSNLDPYPKVFVGKIQGYRFTSGGVGAAPTHRYEVQCGNGIALHMETSPLEFAGVLTDMSMGEVTTGKINNKLVVVRKEGLRLRLLSMVTDERVLPVNDRWGNYLYVDAPVVSTSYGRGYFVKRVTDSSVVEIESTAGDTMVASFSDLALDIDAF